MSKSSKRQKLTKEEIQEENKKLRAEIARNDVNPEDQQRIVDILSKKNIIAYAVVLFLPPVGIWYIWTRREKLHLNRQSVLLWTFVGCVVMWGYIQWVLKNFGIM